MSIIEKEKRKNIEGMKVRFLWVLLWVFIITSVFIEVFYYILTIFLRKERESTKLLLL